MTDPLAKLRAALADDRPADLTREDMAAIVEAYDTERAKVAEARRYGDRKVRRDGEVIIPPTQTGPKMKLVVFVAEEERRRIETNVTNACDAAVDVLKHWSDHAHVDRVVTMPDGSARVVSDDDDPDLYTDPESP